jgi:hypothetical protein
MESSENMQKSLRAARSFSRSAMIENRSRADQMDMSVALDNLVVCACGRHEYLTADAIDAAIFRDELDEKWQKFLRDVAAEDRADELDLKVDEATASAAAEAFRYDHDLITAEETEAWLPNRGLTLDDFSDYFVRRYFADTVREELVPSDEEYWSASPDMRQLFGAHLILSGELDRMTRGLMWRLASRCAETDLSREAISAEEQRFFKRTAVEPAQLSDWLKKLGRDLKWFNEMTAMEAAYRTRCAALLCPAARQRELAGWIFTLTQFETEIIELESRDAAKETLFCLRDDGTSMEEVAAEGRYPYRRVNFLLGDVPTENQRRFLGVSAGDILEPIPRGDGFELCRVITRRQARADDPTVQSRLDQRLLGRHFSDLIGKYVELRFGGVSTPTAK